MKKYQIRGDFFDCQIHRGFLYVWDMEGMLSLYDWDAIKHIMEQVPRANGMYGAIKTFERFRKGLPVEVVGGMFPTDTAFVGSYLYTAVETGLYRGHAVIDSYRRHKFFTSSKPNRVWECPPLSLTANYNGMQLAVSAGEDGLYEVNLSRETETKGLRKVTKEISEVSNKNVIRSRYVKNGSIYSTNENLEKSLHEFLISRDNRGIKVRTYSRDYDFGTIVNQEKWREIAGTKSFSCISRITKKGLEVYPLYKNQKTISLKPRIEMEGTKRKLVAVEPVSVGKIVEYENGLQLRSRCGEEMIKINTPVTRWRWLDTGGQNVLIVVLDSCLEIYEM